MNEDELQIPVEVALAFWKNEAAVLQDRAVAAEINQYVLKQQVAELKDRLGPPPTSSEE